MDYTLNVYVYDRISGTGREETFLLDSCIDREMAYEVIEGMATAQYKHTVLSCEETSDGSIQ